MADNFIGDIHSVLKILNEYLYRKILWKISNNVTKCQSIKLVSLKTIQKMINLNSLIVKPISDWIWDMLHDAITYIHSEIFPTLKKTKKTDTLTHHQFHFINHTMYMTIVVRLFTFMSDQSLDNCIKTRTMCGTKYQNHQSWNFPHENENHKNKIKFSRFNFI